MNLKPANILRRVYIIIALFVIPLFALQAQVNISGKIKGFPNTKIYLAAVYAGRTKTIDSVAVSNESFSFTESDTLPEGVYYLILNPERTAFIQLILNHEDVLFHSEYANLEDSMHIDKSAANKILYDYIHRTHANTLRINYLTQQQAADSTAKSDLAEIKSLQQNNEQLTSHIISDYPHSLLAALLKAQQSRVYNNQLSGKDEKWVFNHLFDHIDLDNKALPATDILSALLDNYLNFFTRTSDSIPRQVDILAIAIDSILYKSRAFPTSQKFFITELANRYRYGDHDVLSRYVETYFGTQDICSADDALTSAHTRLSTLNHTSVGTMAPEIIMPSFEGKALKLTDIKNDYLLLVFWSSFCYHCTQILPKLKQVYDHRNGNALEILAISVDADQTEWQNFIKKEDLTWINYSDLKGWDSPVAKRYYVQGTPTYILLNKEKIIVAKPTTFEGLVTKLKELNLF